MISKAIQGCCEIWNLSSRVRYAHSWDIELKIRREIQYLRAPMYLFILHLKVQWIVTILELNWAERFGGRKLNNCRRPCNWNTCHLTSWKEREWLWNVQKRKRSTFCCGCFIMSSSFSFVILNFIIMWTKKILKESECVSSNLRTKSLIKYTSYQNLRNLLRQLLSCNMSYKIQ